MTIKQLFDLSDSFLQDNIEPNHLTGFIAGAELEIEAVHDYSMSYMEDNNINVEIDGSLRNSGKEFLLPPSNKDSLVNLFKGVHGRLHLGDDPFSIRTSVHVHVNCLYATEHQVKTLLLLYAIFEPLAFNYVGATRRDNIHCMPLNSTYMPSNYQFTLSNIVTKWHKYTAFNLLPLRELGTVEFRHLYGTEDAAVFATWLDFIHVLWQSAMDIGMFTAAHLTDLTVLKDIERKLNTDRFKQLCREPNTFILEDNLLDVKLAFIN